MMRVAIPFRYLFLICWLLPLSYLPAQDTIAAAPAELPTDTLSIFRYLQRDSVLPLTLSVDMRAMYRQKIRLPDYMPAELIFEEPGLAATEWEVKVRARGNVRRNICAFPPLKVKFPKKLLRELNIDPEHNKLKFVTHCRSGDIGSKLVLREYLAYRILNLLTENSFRAQLIQVKYVDSQGKRKPATGYGMLLEDVDELADRIGGKECGDCYFNNPARLSHEDFRLFCVFQYLIGNTDFSVKDLHNLKIIELDSDTEPVYLPIPYDFDYAGIVNASYAVPHESLPIKEVTERYFMGLRFPCDSYTTSVALVESKREKILDLVANFTLLDERERRDIHQYLMDFFEELENPDRRNRAFNCVINR
jgi:hypothetical protein